jgi:hypothetical protein
MQKGIGNSRRGKYTKIGYLYKHFHAVNLYARVLRSKKKFKKTINENEGDVREKRGDKEEKRERRGEGEIHTSKKSFSPPQKVP